MQINMAVLFQIEDAAMTVGMAPGCRLSNLLNFWGRNTELAARAAHASPASCVTSSQDQ
jgi:hypothetical protein